MQQKCNKCLRHKSATGGWAQRTAQRALAANRRAALGQAIVGGFHLGSVLKDYLDAIVAEIKKLEPAGSSNDFVAFVLVREVPREGAGR